MGSILASSSSDLKRLNELLDLNVPSYRRAYSDRMAFVAACYTFGSPRDGDDKWIANIKAPIFRIVNTADCATMLPQSNDIITFGCWILQLIPKFVLHFSPNTGLFL